MLSNRRNQRLGDLAAGTLVVHERDSEASLWTTASSRTITASAIPLAPAGPLSFAPGAVDLPADAVARLGPEDVNVIDHFFSRAIDIDIPRRRQLAERLAQQMAAKMGIPLPEGVTAERFLESAAHTLRGIRR
jgi:hypothetical protein